MRMQSNYPSNNYSRSLVGSEEERVKEATDWKAFERVLFAFSEPHLEANCHSARGQPTRDFLSKGWQWVPRCWTSRLYQPMTIVHQNDGQHWREPILTNGKSWLEGRNQMCSTQGKYVSTKGHDRRESVTSGSVRAE